MNNYLTLLIILLSSSVTYCQSSLLDSLAIEDPEFNEVFFSNQPLNVKGTIHNLPLSLRDSIEISYSILSPNQLDPHSFFTQLSGESTFSFTIDTYYPNQTLVLSIGQLCTTFLHINEEILIELDYNKLSRDGPLLFEGEGLTFSGRDGPLTQYLNEYQNYKRENQVGLEAEVFSVTTEPQIPDDVFHKKLDSLNTLLEISDHKFVTANPSPYASLIKNNRQSTYLSFICLKYWHRKMPESIFNIVKAHKHFSGTGSHFHHYLFTYLDLKSWKNIANKSILDKANATSNLLDSIFPSAKADFLKLRLTSAHISERDSINTFLLDKIETPWCKAILESRLKKSTAEQQHLDEILKSSSSINSEDLTIGQPIEEFPFGAKLYKVDSPNAELFLQNLRRFYNKKLLYIDFWATWCSPCIEELPKSKSLHLATKETSVQFLYLCTSQGLSLIHI